MIWFLCDANYTFLFIDKESRNLMYVFLAIQKVFTREQTAILWNDEWPLFINFNGCSYKHDMNKVKIINS